METTEIYAHAFAYAQQALRQGLTETSQEEQAYYDKFVLHVEENEEAYVRGYFAGIDTES